jgi:hypothetical protein
VNVAPIGATDKHGGAGIARAASDEAISLGLLADAAHTHQQLADASLVRLEAHTRGLDAVVRDEIRHTLVSECGELVEEIDRSVTALRSMQRAASLRATWWSTAVITAVASAMVMGLERLLPSAAELQALRAQREQLAAQVKQLSAVGGRIELRRCGSEQRLCVRVDRSAPVYGTDADFLIIKGY